MLIEFLKTVAYSDYNQNIEIPDLDKVKEIFNA